MRKTSKSTMPRFCVGTSPATTKDEGMPIKGFRKRISKSKGIFEGFATVKATSN